MNERAPRSDISICTMLEFTKAQSVLENHDPLSTRVPGGKAEGTPTSLKVR